MKSDGFTLIELVVTVAIVGLLATVAMPLVQLTAKRDKEHELRVALRDIRTAIDAYKRAADQGRIEQEADATGFPPSLELLVTGVEDATNPDHKKIYFMRRMPRDPFFPDASVDAVTTWGVRSYVSPAEDPQPGNDVYDVYSMANGHALDGSAYRDW